MRIIIITQNEPFYLSQNLKYLIEILPRHSKIVGCVVTDASPFGKKDSFLGKAKRTYSVFGLRFFLYYSFKFFISKLDSDKSVIKLLRKKNIPLISIEGSINSKKSVAQIKKYQPDLLISILGNQIFKAPIIDLAPKGCLNLHTALLPRYRGLMPTFWVLKNNEEKTGVSVFYVDEGIDSGPIVVQKEVEIGNRSQAELIKFTKKLGMEAIAESVDLIQKDMVKIIENNATQKSYYTFPTKKDVREFRKNKKRFF